jgi:uncharacterized protein YjbK
MMAQLERETKLVLSAEDYGRILEEGRLLASVDQLNVYFHDPERIDEMPGYLRVRFSSDTEAVATLKIPVGWSGGIREMLEVERPLREMGSALYPRPRRRIFLPHDLPTEFGSSFVDLGITQLRRLGWLRNLRCLMDLPPHGTVELDRAFLPGGEILYEVEIEAALDATHAALMERVRDLAPSARLSRTGKLTRFLAAVSRRS